MNRDASAQFLAQVERFVAGENTTADANTIEGILLEHFTDEPWFDDVSVALAQYAPGGGEHYYTAS